MAFPVGLVLRDIAPELPHQGVGIPFHLPAGLRVVWRGVVRDYTQQPEDALVTYRGRLSP